ncbi:DNA-binding XRE family transcriptional regulator [Labrenzia sp. EL_142]|nr:DNA-binding XRE family transcriptional regulator [Labrenzia sp. EL_142]
MSFGILRRLRKRTGISQHELGALVGCSQSTIHRIETGSYLPRGALELTISSWMRKQLQKHEAEEIAHDR